MVAGTLMLAAPLATETVPELVNDEVPSVLWHVEPLPRLRVPLLERRALSKKRTCAPSPMEPEPKFVTTVPSSVGVAERGMVRETLSLTAPPVMEELMVRL